MSGMPSGVNEKMPLKPSSIRTSSPRSAGTTAWAARHDPSYDSGVNGRVAGMTGAAVGWRIVAGSIGRGSWA